MVEMCCSNGLGLMSRLLSDERRWNEVSRGVR